MTFWEQYKLYLKEKSSVLISGTMLGLLTSFAIKWWTGKHYLLGLQMNGMSVARFLVVHSIGAFIGMLVIVAIQVYLDRSS
jgi:hypothetical protein